MPRLCVAFALAAVARAQTSLVDDDDAYDPARKIPAGIDDPDYHMRRSLVYGRRGNLPR